MSRSNDPATNASGWPAGRAPGPEQDQQSWSTWLRGRRPGGEQQAQSGYHYPQQPAPADPYAQHQQAPAPGYGDPYEQAAPGHAPYGQQPHPQYGYAQQQPAYDPHARHAGYPEPGLSQLTPRGAPQHDYGQFGPAPDPRGYDLGSYGAEPRYDQGYAEPDLNGPLYGNLQPPHEPGHNALEPYGDEGDYEMDEPRRGGRKLLVLGALVGAVAVGGGLAYGYKSVFAPPAQTAATPVIKQDARPDKTKPADPGGKQFAHTDSKIMGRLGDGGAAATAGAAASSPAQATPVDDNDSSGQRKVQTVAIGRDGSILPPATPPQPQPTVSVPGLTIVDGFGGRSLPQPPQAQQAVATRSMSPGGGSPPVAPPPQRTAAVATTAVSASPATPAPAAAPAPQKPVVVSKAAPPKGEEDELDAIIAQAKKAAPKKVETAAAAPAAAAAASTAVAGAAGYVAVVASVPVSSNSRMDALKQFADMQQKYATVLQNKTPDVQEANLGAKGMYHRLLVGPPGSRDQASALCTQLKAAGYGSCWVTAY